MTTHMQALGVGLAIWAETPRVQAPGACSGLLYAVGFVDSAYWKGAAGRGL